jgi:hypothetical protein
MTTTVSVGLLAAALLAAVESGERLPGREVSLGAAVRFSQIIVVARVVEPLEVATDQKGWAAYLNLKLKVSRSLKGTPGDGVLVLYELPFHPSPDGGADPPLKAGTDYLVFIHRDAPKTFTGRKVLPATKEALDAVAAELRKEERLTGSRLGLDEAVRRSQLIVVARVLETGSAHFLGAGRAYFGPNRLKPIRTLKGTLGADPFKTDFRINHDSSGWSEQLPEEGKDYVIFFDYGKWGRARDCLKLLPATGEQIDAVRKAQRDELRLPGSAVSDYIASGRAGVIFQGTLVGLGRPRPAPNAVVYPDARVRVVRTHKGTAEGEHRAELTVATGPEESTERTPIEGEDYVFFVETPEREAPRWFKMMRARDAGTTYFIHIVSEFEPPDDPLRKSPPGVLSRSAEGPGR